MGKATSKNTKKGEEMVTLIIPKDSENRKNDSLFVSVNGRKMVIKRGVRVKVPKAHAAVIRGMERQKLASEKYIEEHADR